MKNTPSAISGSVIATRQLLPPPCRLAQQRPTAPEAGSEIQPQTGGVQIRPASPAKMDPQIRIGDVARKHERPAAGDFQHSRQAEVRSQHDKPGQQPRPVARA